MQEKDGDIAAAAKTMQDLQGELIRTYCGPLIHTVFWLFRNTGLLQYMIHFLQLAFEIKTFLE